ncbi:MAG: hypothetical protein LQ344_007116 [Seirophora lacunosa]|nr:MAG: hypothetical protein LQ344_007116 [Seirophora lacunosa]
MFPQSNDDLADSANLYPTSFSSLLLPTASVNIFRALSSLSRTSLSISNRLSSIHHDSLFVRQMAERYQLPLIANERCGSWYIPPDIKSGSAYFKSTDGHQGQWAFSPRRLNLHVLDIVEKHGGCIIVDSTRRGKSMPDALSKTVPIWCAVMNSLLFGQNCERAGLYTPDEVVSPSEHSQIEARLDTFIEEAKHLHLNLQARRQTFQKPIRPIFVPPTSTLSPASCEDSYYPIICLTASSLASSSTTHPPTYVQGAADDSESWSQGLTPSLFWTHKHQLLSTSEDDLPSLIHSLLVAPPSPASSTDADPATLIHPTQSLYIAPLPSTSPLTTTTTSSSWDAIIVCAPTGPFEQNPTPTTTSPKTQILHLRCPSGKRGSRALRTQWHHVIHFLDALLHDSSSSARPPPRILCTCPSGADLSVGVALVILCRFADGEGVLLSTGRECVVDKTLVRQRLAWITTARPEANPSRETLQAVNVCLMGV